MRWLAKPSRALLFSVLGLTAGAALAGRSCEEKPVDPAQAMAAFDNALALGKKLDEGGQNLVVLARRGQNLEKYGVTFSHAAFAVKQAGAWTVYHDLNLCGTAVSKLYVQGLAEFLADDLISQEVAIVVPAPWLQSRLKEALSSKDEQFRMHEKVYSAVAYPYATHFQNSNGWLLETYARAAAETLLATRAQAQAWLNAVGYSPSVINLGALTRLGARMFKANVSFEDQPPALRWSGKITASTGDSVLHFIARGAVPQPSCLHGKFAETVCLVTP
jgi:hypothetical protein